MTRILLSILLIPCLLITSAGALFAVPEGQAPEQIAEEDAPKRNAEGQRALEGQEIFPEKENALMRELGQQHSYTSRVRRFEIVFFISIPITLLLGFTLMDGLARMAYDKKNPDRTLQQPHYIYMFSTTFLSSLYVAIKDARSYNPPESAHKHTEVSELRLELPIVGVRF